MSKARAVRRLISSLFDNLFIVVERFCWILFYCRIFCCSWIQCVLVLVRLRIRIQIQIQIRIRIVFIPSVYNLTSSFPVKLSRRSDWSEHLIKCRDKNINKEYFDIYWSVKLLATCSTTNCTDLLYSSLIVTVMVVEHRSHKTEKWAPVLKCANLPLIT